MMIQEQVQTQKMQLINENFSPSEAFDIIASSIEGNINFYKIQHLSSWEGNHSLSRNELDEKISLLNHQKNELRKLIREAKEAGYDLNIEGQINIKLIKSDLK